MPTVPPSHQTPLWLPAFQVVQSHRASDTSITGSSPLSSSLLSFLTWTSLLQPETLQPTFLLQTAQFFLRHSSDSKPPRLPVAFRIKSRHLSLAFRPLHLAPVCLSCPAAPFMCHLEARPSLCCFPATAHPLVSFQVEHPSLPSSALSPSTNPSR